MSTAEQTLEAAKTRLKAAFARLEEAVDARVEAAEKQAQQAANKAGGEGTNQQLELLNRNLSHVKEENSSLHALLGKERELTKQLKFKQETAGKRVDSLLKQLEPLVSE